MENIFGGAKLGTSGIIAIVLGILCVGLLIGLIVVIIPLMNVKKDYPDYKFDFSVGKKDTETV